MTHTKNESLTSVLWFRSKAPGRELQLLYVKHVSWKLKAEICQASNLYLLANAFRTLSLVKIYQSCEGYLAGCGII